MACARDCGHVCGAAVRGCCGARLRRAAAARGCWPAHSGGDDAALFEIVVVREAEYGAEDGVADVVGFDERGDLQQRLRRRLRQLRVPAVHAAARLGEPAAHERREQRHKLGEDDVVGGRAAAGEDARDGGDLLGKRVPHAQLRVGKHLLEQRDDAQRRLRRPDRLGRVTKLPDIGEALDEETRAHDLLAPLQQRQLLLNLDHRRHALVGGSGGGRVFAILCVLTRAKLLPFSSEEREAAGMPV